MVTKVNNIQQDRCIQVSKACSEVGFDNFKNSIVCPTSKTIHFPVLSQRQ